METEELDVSEIEKELLRNVTNDASGTRLAEIAKKIEFSNEDGLELAMRMRYDGYDKENKHMYGLTPLQLAVMFCDIEVVTDYIALGCDVKVVTEENAFDCKLNILELAFEFNSRNFSLLEFLLKKFPLLITNTVIIDCLCSMSSDIVEICIKTINNRDKCKFPHSVLLLMLRLVFYYGRSTTVLNYVVSRLDDEAIRKELENLLFLLCESKFVADYMNIGDINEIRNNVNGLFEFLIKRKTIKWIRNYCYKGKTVWHLLSRSDNTFVFTFLIKELLDKKNSMSLDKYSELMYELLVRRDDNGKTCLHLALENSSYRVLSYMLQLIQTKHILERSLLLEDKRKRLPIHASVKSPFSGLTLLNQLDREFYMNIETEKGINNSFDKYLEKRGDVGPFKQMNITKKDLLLSTCEVKTSSGKPKKNINVIEYAKRNKLKKTTYRKLYRIAYGGIEYMNKFSFYTLLESYALIVICIISMFLLEKDHLACACDFIFILLSFSMYVRLLKKSPGIVEPDRDIVKIDNSCNIIVKIDKLEDISQPNHCPECMILKKDRVKHCGKCNHCVERFDHCCTFIDKDVGKGNHKLFFLFVFINGFTNIYWAIHFAHYLYKVKREDELFVSLISNHLIVLLSFIIHLGYGVFTLFLTLSNIYLILNGLTSYEADHLSEEEQEKRGGKQD